MPITIHCPCQNPYRVKDELAGKTIKCPYCQQPVSVPMSDAESSQRFASLNSRDPMSYSDVRQGDAYPQQSLDPYPYYASPQPAAQANSEMEQFNRIAQSQAGESLHRQRSSGVHGGKVLLGLVMMGGAAFWFFSSARLPRGAVFLFIFGLISFVKGLSGSSSE